VRSVGDDPRARFTTTTTGAFVFLILSPVLSLLSLAVSSRSLVETNKYLLFSFLTLCNNKTQVAEAEMAAEMAAEVAAEDGAVRAVAAEAEMAAEMAAEVVAAEVAAAEMAAEVVAAAA